MDRPTDKVRLPNRHATNTTCGLQCSGAHAGPARGAINLDLRMLRGRKACGQTQSVDQPGVSQLPGFHMPSAALLAQQGAWHGYAMACMAMDCPSQKQAHTRGPDRGQDRPEARAGARLMQLARGRRSPCGAVSCTVCTCTYVVQAGVLRIVCTSSTRHHKRRLGMVPFFLRTLDSHVTRWDRIEPALIRPPRIPAARGRTRDPRR